MEWLQRIAAQTGHTFIRIATLSKSWLSPSGKIYPVKQSEMHEDWALNHLSLLKLKGDLSKLSAREVMDLLMESGWLRISSVGIHVTDLDRSARAIDEYLFENKDKLPKLVRIDAPYGTVSIPREDLLEEGIKIAYEHAARLHILKVDPERLLSDQEILQGLETEDILETEESLV